MKECNKCRQALPLETFHRDRTQSDGFGRRCKECWTAQYKVWYAANRDVILAKNAARHLRNREKNLANQARYRDENRETLRVSNREQSARYRKAHLPQLADRQAKRRARKLAVTVEHVDRLAVYKREGGICHICQKHVPVNRFELDHLVPLSKNGEHSMRNVRLAHRSCNAIMGVGRLPAQLLLIG